jgi:hypothetical protein
MFYEEIFKLLNKKRVDYIVVGGVALALHGVVRLTADLDLMIHLDEKNIAKFIDVMGELGYKPRIPVRMEELKDADKRKWWLKEKNMKVFSFYHSQQAISLVDIFIYEPIDYEKARRNLIRIKAGNLSIPVASMNDLIKLKKISGREQDLADIEALKKMGRYEKRKQK